jgi:hypothetical protein
MPILRSPLLAQAGFAHGFSERDVSDAALSRQLGHRPVTRVTQVHGSLVVEARDARFAKADAIVARGCTSGGADEFDVVGVGVADCVPVLIAHPETGDVAAVHAGWRGIVAGVLCAAAECLGRPQGAIAAIGPCIGACCFEVDRDVALAICAAIFGAGGVSPAGARPLVTPQGGDKVLVDLRAAAREQLRRLGMSDHRIDDVPGCTKHEPERFHSYRRDGPRSGRMLAAIAARR